MPAILGSSRSRWRGRASLLTVRRILLAMLAVLTVLALGGAPAQAQYQPGQCGFILDPGVVDPGGQTSVIGSGAPRGSQVVISIDGQVVGTATAADDEVGSFQTTITAPAQSGNYSVDVQCGTFSLTQLLIVTPTACNFTVSGAPGAPVQAQVPGFEVGTPYTLIFRPPSVQVGQGTVASDPQPISFNIPTSVTPGDYTLSIAGTGVNGQAKVLDCPARVTSTATGLTTTASTPTVQGSLPRTGGEAGTLVTWGVILVATGGLLALVARRRREPSPA